MTAGVATLRDDDVGARGGRLFGLRQGLHLANDLASGRLIRPVKGVASPNDSSTAAGLVSSATSSAARLHSSAQVIKPMATRMLPASPSCSRVVAALA
jgi:hypothetical protein